jgi:surfeit locus 1 family protein
MNRRAWAALMAAAVGIGVTASLGFWQLRRADAKLVMQAQWDQVLAGEPKTLSRSSLDEIERGAPMRVRARGSWLAASSVWLDNRPLDGRAGFWLVTPLQLSGDGAVVLVFRGWAPRDPADRLRQPRIESTTGQVDIEGIAVSELSKLLQLGESTYAVPLPAIWQNLDFDRFESESGLAVARFVLHQTDATREGEGLMRQPVRAAAGVDRNYGYAVQWFSLAALIAGLAAFFSWRAHRSRRVAP